MRYQTLIPLRYETSKGVIEIQAGGTFKLKDPEPISELLAEGKVRPVSEVMAKERQELTDWLHRFNFSVDEIKRASPELYQNIQDTKGRLDEAYAQENLLAFQDILSKLKELYAEALFARRKVGIKIYSEILGCYLWVVETDEDMHSLRSQGITEAIYTTDEIRKLKDLSKDSLKEIHKAKEVFPESKVEEIAKYENSPNKNQP